LWTDSSSSAKTNGTPRDEHRPIHNYRQYLSNDQRRALTSSAARAAPRVRARSLSGLGFAAQQDYAPAGAYGVESMAAARRRGSEVGRASAVHPWVCCRSPRSPAAIYLRTA
jgi:hypothetical protein